MEKLLKHKPTTKRHDFFKNKLISFVENTDYLPVFYNEFKEIENSKNIYSPATFSSLQKTLVSVNSTKPASFKHKPKKL